MAINTYQSVANYEQKNRSLIRIFWFFILVISCVELLNYILYHTLGYPIVIGDYFRNRLVLPVVINCALGCALTLLNRSIGSRKAVQMSVVITFAYFVLANIVVFVHYSISVVYIMYVIPIFLSLIYNSRKLTFAAFAAGLGSYLIVVFLYLPSRAAHTFEHDYMDTIATIAIIGMSLLVGLQILVTFRDLTDRIIDETIKKVTMERASKEDSLTKLYNHAVFYDYLDLAILSFKSTSTPFTIAVFDIDNFKIINDTYGHVFGDQVLLELVNTIQNNVSPDDIAFRYGGEEFAIIAFSDVNTTLGLAERIREQFAQLVIESEPGARFSVSCGLSEYAEMFVGKREFFASADRALYIAKRTGKNKCVVSTDEDMGQITGEPEP